MYRVRVKRFLDSQQYQIFEDNPVLDQKGQLPDYLFERTKRKDESLEFIPFVGKYDFVRSIPDEIEEKMKKDESVRSSRSRTIKNVYDYGRSNMWEWFVTLTFDPEKVDSFNYSEVSEKLSKWLNNLRRNCPDMKYLAVPELHKSGRWHFHLLMSCVDGLNFVDSGHFSDTGQPVYNLGNYKFGWSTAIRLDGDMAVVSYLCKYITKELCTSTKGKKRYWVSRNLDKPEVIDHWVADMSLDDILKQIGVSEADHIKTVSGYKDVHYIDFKI